MGWYFFLRLNITLIGRVAIRLLLAFLMSGKGCTAPVKKKSETPLKSELSLTKVCTAARTVPVIFWTRTPLSGWLCPVFKRYHGRRLTVNDTQCVNERKVCARERTVVRSKGKHFLKAAYERRERRPGVLSVKLKTNTNKNASTPIVCCFFQISSIHDYLLPQQLQAAHCCIYCYGNTEGAVCGRYRRTLGYSRGWNILLYPPTARRASFLPMFLGMANPLSSLNTFLRVLCTRLQSQCCISTTLTAQSGATTASQNTGWEASGGVVVDTDKLSVIEIEKKLFDRRLPVRDRCSSTRESFQSRLWTLRLCRVSEVCDVYSAIEQEILLPVVLRSRTVFVCT